MSNDDEGSPFGEDSTEPVDDWSRAVFEALRGWPLAKGGRWMRWPDGWLVLRIEEANGERLEPFLAVELETLEEQIHVDFGSWRTPLGRWHGPLTEEAARTAEEARKLVEGWFRGEVRLASYSDETGWRCSKIIEGGELPDSIEPVPRALGDRGRVEVQSWRRSDWRYFDDYGNGIWIEQREIGTGD